MKNFDKIKNFNNEELAAFLFRFDKEKIQYCNENVCSNYKKCHEEDHCLENEKGDFFDIKWWLEQEEDSNVSGFNI